jgi:hypothetical protein
MTLARRTFLAFVIASATALAVTGLAIIDAGSGSHGVETLHRD